MFDRIQIMPLHEKERPSLTIVSDKTGCVTAIVGISIERLTDPELESIITGQMGQTTTCSPREIVIETEIPNFSWTISPQELARKRTPEDNNAAVMQIIDAIKRIEGKTLTIRKPLQGPTSS